MFGMGGGELVVILIVALLVLGPDKLPEAAKAVGKGIRELRRHTRSLEETIEQDETIGGTMRELKSALRGDTPPPVRPRPPTDPTVAAAPLTTALPARPAEAQTTAAPPDPAGPSPSVRPNG